MSQAKGKLLIGIASAAVLGCVAGFAYFHSHGAHFFSASGSGAGGIYGSYLFVHESSGSGPAQDAEVVMKFVPPNMVTVRATKPDETLAAVGSFTLTDQKISLVIPELGKDVKDGSYSYDGVHLVLPMLIIQDGEGTSNWERIDSADDPLNAAILDYYANVGKLGRQASLAGMAQKLRQDSSVQSATIEDDKLLLITYSDGYKEFFLAPPEADSSNLQAPGTEPSAAYPVQPDMRPHDSGRGHLVHVQFLPGGLPGGPPPGPAALMDSWLKDEPEPVSHGDAPADKTALIIGPFNTLPILLPGKTGLHYATFASTGQDLDFIAKQLTRAGYQVPDIYTDSKVTVKLLYDLLQNKSPGVLYFSTHGGVIAGGNDVLLSTAQQIPSSMNTWPKRERYMKQTLIRSLGADVYEKVKSSLMIGTIFEGQVYMVSITGSFFRAVGANFSSSLIYLDGCDTVQSKAFRQALNAKSFAGYQKETQFELGADMSKGFFLPLGRKTRSDREAMSFAIKYLFGVLNYKAKPQVMNHEKGWNLDNFVVYRQGKTEPEKPLTVRQHQMLFAAREWAVRAREVAGGPEDLVGRTEGWRTCKAELSTPNGNRWDAYCQEALGGQDVSDEEIDDAKGELCGYGGKPRFTLVEK